MSFVLALDQGTTSSRAIVFDHAGDDSRGRATGVPADLSAAGLGRARRRRDLGDAVGVAARGARERRDRARATSRRSASPTSARRPSCGTARPAARSPTRSSGRTAARAACATRCAPPGTPAMIARKTGLVLDPYFSGTKIAWLLDNVAGARERASAASSRSAPSTRWLVWKLTGGAVHVTDRRNASRTLLFDIRTRRLGRRAARAVRRAARDAAAHRALVAEVCGETRRSAASADPDRRHRRRSAGGALRAGVLCAGAGEEHVRHRLLPADEHGQQPRSPRRNGLLTTVAWQHRTASSTTRSRAASSSAAPSCSGCATGSGSSGRAAEIEALAASVPDNGGVYFVPAFAGLGAPHWDADARGAIVGLTRGTTARAHRARGARERSRSRSPTCSTRCRRTPAIR